MHIHSQLTITGSAGREHRPLGRTESRSCLFFRMIHYQHYHRESGQQTERPVNSPQTVMKQRQIWGLEQCVREIELECRALLFPVNRLTLRCKRRNPMEHSRRPPADAPNQHPATSTTLLIKSVLLIKNFCFCTLPVESVVYLLNLYHHWCPEFRITGLKEFPCVMDTVSCFSFTLFSLIKSMNVSGLKY